jgi:uncharacterized protein YebE (UPF0316 family)
MNVEYFSELFGQELFLYFVLPLFIFLARIFDQSLGILRILFATKGFKYLVLVAGFFESAVWLIAISQIMQNLSNVFCYIAFAGGFAFGNYFGMYLENKLSIGSVIIRVVFQKDSEQTLLLLKQLKFRVTEIDALGMDGPVKMIFSTIRRKDLKQFLGVLSKNNPSAFYTVEDVKKVKDGYFQAQKSIFRFAAMSRR